MRLSIVAGLLLIGSLLLTGCTAGREVAPPKTPPIFERPQIAGDELPAGVDEDLDADTTKYVGQDSAGDKYWDGYKTDSSAECIVHVPADDGHDSVSCGGPGMTATTSAGKVIEFASS